MRAKTMRDEDRTRQETRRAADAGLPLDRMLSQAERMLRDGDAASAEEQALDGFARARRDGVDPTDLPRRFLLLAADAARAEHEDGLANAYLGEARQLMP
jgi:hypothetical protein